jgi:hypothetical protein
MSCNIDHIIWACQELGSGIEKLETMTGARAEAGGKHPGLGTHNALIHIGNRSYLEIVAPDPDQGGGPWSRSLQAMTGPGLLHWAVARPKLGDYRNGLPGLIGGGNEIMQASRQHPTLGPLRWQLLLLANHEFGCLVPFLIDWRDSAHPAELLEPVCTLTEVRITTPRLPELLKIASWLRLDAEFAVGEESKLEFLIDTPRGEIKLETAHPLPAGVSFGA